MKCDICGRKIPRSGYRWLDKIWCYRCFERERGKYLDKEPDVDWNYEIVEAPKPQKTLEAIKK